MNDLYSERYKSVMKEIKYYANKYKDMHYSLIGRINIAKCSHHPK